MGTSKIILLKVFFSGPDPLEELTAFPDFPAGEGGTLGKECADRRLGKGGGERDKGCEGNGMPSGCTSLSLSLSLSLCRPLNLYGKV